MQSPPRQLQYEGQMRWRPLASSCILYHAVSGNVKRSGKVTTDPHLDSDRHQNVISSRGSPIAHAYHV